VGYTAFVHLAYWWCAISTKWVQKCV